MPTALHRRPFVVVLPLVVAVVAAFCVSALAATQRSGATTQSGTTSGLPVLQASNTAAIKEHIGDQVIVTGIIKSAQWSESGKVMNIEFEGADADAFGVAVFEGSRERFDKSFGGDFIKTITGAEVRFKGFVTEYGGRESRYAGRPELILRDPSQITIVEPAAPTTTPTTKPTTRSSGRTQGA